MALIKCPNCGRSISDRAVKCPKCGAEIHHNSQQIPLRPMNGNLQSSTGYNQQSMQGYPQQQMGYQQPNQGYYPQSNQQEPSIEVENSMSIFEAVRNCYDCYADFYGRARRKEFWYFNLFLVLTNILISVITYYVILNFPQYFSLMKWLYYGWTLVNIIPQLSVFWRRMHDIGKCGAWFFINIIPFIGWVLSLFYLCEEGDHGENEYGDDPKYELI